LSLDGPEHTRHRAAFAAAFRPAITRTKMQRRVQAIAGRLVNMMVDGGPVDLRSGLAAPLAAETVIEVLGLVETTPADVLGWYTSIVAEVSAVTIDPDSRADDSLMDGVRASVVRSVAAADSSLAMIREDADLTDAEFASNVAIVLFGALETSEAMITNLLWWVIGDAELQRHLRATPGRRGRAVDESLRLEPGAALVDRFAVATTEIAGVEVEAGDPVTVSLTAANRDPRFHEEPDRFSLDREDEPPHLTFATGPHVCIGAPLARMEARAALDAVLRAPSGPTAADAGFDPPTGLVFRKPARLVVNWSA
jgi:cytochrome P450